MRTTQTGLAGQTASGFAPSVTGAAATFLAAWAGYAGESGALADGFVQALRSTRLALRPDRRGSARPRSPGSTAGWARPDDRHDPDPRVRADDPPPAGRPRLDRRRRPGAVRRRRPLRGVRRPRRDRQDGPRLVRRRPTTPTPPRPARASGSTPTMAATVKRVAHVCSGHGDTLTDLLRDCDALEDTKRWLDGSRDDLVADVDAAREATPEEVAALQDRAQDLRTGVPHPGPRPRGAAAQGARQRGPDAAPPSRAPSRSSGSSPPAARPTRWPPGAMGEARRARSRRLPDRRSRSGGAR